MKSTLRSVAAHVMQTPGDQAALATLRRHRNTCLLIDGMEVFVVAATPRSNWIFVRLRTNKGLTGLGEATLGAARDVPLAPFYKLLAGTSPFSIETYREASWPLVVSGGLPAATAFSALEQALWDIVGKALDASVAELFESSWDTPLAVYANINRGTMQRTAQGFAARATAAKAQGFAAFKAAPFDHFSARPEALASPVTQLRAREAVDAGVDVMYAIRKVLAPEDKLMIDCHSFLSVDEAIEVARSLEAVNLYWFEEPCPPEDLASNLAIKAQVTPPLAGGELLFATQGFRPLCERNCFDVIMPDVKHCGGVLELVRIAAMASQYDVTVAPHNPSGPLASIVSAHACAAAQDVDLLEIQWGEVDWRGELLSPPENYEAGKLQPTLGAGYGVTLNDALVREHALT